MRMGRIGLVLTVAAALVFGAGCGSREKAGQEAPPPAKMQPGGQLIYGSLQEPNTLNPLLSDLLSTAEVGSLVFSGLVQTNDKGEWIADLATEVPTPQNGGVSPDGLTVIYRLRPGVTWHDGAAFTSADEFT